MYACVFLLQGRVALADCKEVKYKSNQIKFDFWKEQSGASWGPPHLWQTTGFVDLIFPLVVTYSPEYGEHEKGWPANLERSFQLLPVPEQVHAYAF